MRPFVIAGRAIGTGAPCFVIAEAGVNHNGDASLAHELIDAAARAGADAVKFQTFEPELLASRAAAKADYQIAETGDAESQLEMLRRLALPRESYPKLKRHAEERGIVFLSTPFDEPSADFLVELGLPALKLASGEVTNHPLLAHAARTGLPLLVSTGMSDMNEVAAAVRCIEEAGASALALLHCTSSYPAPFEAANLRAVLSLADRFPVPVGYSDHTPGLAVPLAAVALGAALLEKHLTLDRSLPGPDHAASLEPSEFRELLLGVRQVEAALGDGLKVSQPCESNTRAIARRSLFASGDLPAGVDLQPHHLVALRPGTGLSPDRLASLVGRRLRRDLRKGAMLTEEDLA